MHKPGLFVVAALLLLSSAACMNRNLRSVRDVPGTRYTLIETLDTTSYFGMWSTQKHVFWECTQAGLALSCEKACEGTTDLACPTGGGITVSSSNTTVR